jgi:hypothetical protein
MASTALRPPASTPTFLGTRAPTPMPGPLTDARAMALIREEVLASGVTSDALSVQIAREPRWASIRYSSSCAADARTFRPQMMLIALAAARFGTRAQPAADGGMRLAVMPGGRATWGW